MSTITRQEGLNVLGLTENANKNQIKEAFRTRALAIHPDKIVIRCPVWTSETEKGELRKQIVEEFIKISQAYELLMFNRSSELTLNDALDLLKRDLESYSLTVTISSGGSNSFCSNYSFYVQEELKEGIQDSATRMEGGRIVNILGNNSVLNETIISFSFSENIPTEFKNQFSASGSECMVRELLQNARLTQVNAPDWLFDDEQRVRLNERMQRNLRVRDQEHRQARVKIISFLAGGLLTFAGMTLGSPLTAALFFKATGLAIISAFVSRFFGNLIYTERFTFHNRCESLYDAEKLDSITDPSEIQALHRGLEANTYWGYGKSFFDLAAYTNWRAFAAASNYRMNQNEKFVQKIRNLRPTP